MTHGETTYLGWLRDSLHNDPGDVYLATALWREIGRAMQKGVMQAAGGYKLVSECLAEWKSSIMREVIR